MRHLMAIRSAGLVSLLACSAFLLQSCPLGNITGLLDDCFDENTISESEFEDMNFFEQLLYEENDCGRYVRRFDI